MDFNRESNRQSRMPFWPHSTRSITNATSNLPTLPFTPNRESLFSALSLPCAPSSPGCALSLNLLDTVANPTSIAATAVAFGPPLPLVRRSPQSQPHPISFFSVKSHYRITRYHLGRNLGRSQLKPIQPLASGSVATLAPVQLTSILDDPCCRSSSLFFFLFGIHHL